MQFICGEYVYFIHHANERAEPKSQASRKSISGYPINSPLLRHTDWLRAASC